VSTWRNGGLLVRSPRSSRLTIGCGDDPQPVTVEDLPPKLAASIPRLEAAGFETQPVHGGLEALPALLVRSEPPVVLTTVDAGNGFVSPFLNPVRDPEGVRASRTASEVLHISGLCVRT